MYSPSSSRSLIRSACSVVALLGAAAFAGRGVAAQQPDEALVSELARVLAAADGRAFDPALFHEALQHPEPLVRRQAALAAGRIGDAAAVDALVEALADSNQAVAAAAAFALGLLKEPRAAGPLLALVRSVPAASQGPAMSRTPTSPRGGTPSIHSPGCAWRAPRPRCSMRCRIPSRSFVPSPYAV